MQQENKDRGEEQQKYNVQEKQEMDEVQEQEEPLKRKEEPDKDDIYKEQEKYGGKGGGEVGER